METTKLNEEKINKFGSIMRIIEYRKYNDIDILFPEYNWIYKKARYNNFEKGTIKCPYERRYYNIGYLGEGIYKICLPNGKHTKIYDTWHDMLKRCYDPKYQKKYPTYKDCTVCDDWLNFQNFAKWYEDNYYEIPNETMTLDKDILVKGNKIYGPNTCIFTPQKINLIFVKSNNNKLPVGIYYDKTRKKYVAQCGKNGKLERLSFCDTPEEAFVIYKTFKEKYIKEIADQYKELIPETLYNAMYEYEIEWED